MSAEQQSGKRASGSGASGEEPEAPEPTTKSATGAGGSTPPGKKADQRTDAAVEANGSSTGPDPDGDLEAAAEAVEADIADIAAIAAQRDEYLALAQRLQAEFENYRKRATKEREDAQSWGASRLAEQLLPVLDACDSALVHGAEAVNPIYRTLIEALTKAGLEVIPSDDVAFDPREHDAVMHEPSEDGGESVVAETLRTGYRWNGRVLRPAMVKVRG